MCREVNPSDYGNCQFEKCKHDSKVDPDDESEYIEMGNSSIPNDIILMLTLVL